MRLVTADDSLSMTLAPARHKWIQSEYSLCPEKNDF